MNETRKDVIYFLEHWHSTFILDYWWRKKYNVPFGSREHREMNFIDMLMEYEEELEIRKSKERSEVEVFEESDEVVHLSKKEIDDDYENINLEDYNNG